MIQFDEHIFQTGWFNHQLDQYALALFPPSFWPFHIAPVRHSNLEWRVYGWETWMSIEKFRVSGVAFPVIFLSTNRQHHKKTTQEWKVHLVKKLTNFSIFWNKNPKWFGIGAIWKVSKTPHWGETSKQPETPRWRAKTMAGRSIRRCRSA